MSWASDYRFVEPMIDLRGDDARADVLGAELGREVAPGHLLHGKQWRVIAEAAPQDELVAEVEGRVVLVHLTWSRHAEPPPYPTTEDVGSSREFDQLIEYRY